MAIGVGGILGNRGLPMQRRAGGLLSPEDEAARIEALGGLLAPEEPGRKSFFAGTGEVGWKDGLSLLLASVADGMARNSGYEANASNDLFAGRAKVMDKLEKAAERQKQEAFIRARMTEAGLTPAQQDAEIHGFKLNEPDEFDRNAKRAGIAPGSQEYRDAALGKLKGDPFITTTLPDGRFYAGPASQLRDFATGGGNMGGGVTEDDWNSAKPMGGGTGNGVVTFP